MSAEGVKPEIVLATRLGLWGPALIFYAELGKLYFCTAYLGYVEKKMCNIAAIKATRNVGVEIR